MYVCMYVCVYVCIIACAVQRSREIKLIYTCIKTDLHMYTYPFMMSEEEKMRFLASMGRSEALSTAFVCVCVCMYVCGM